jgi:chorismate synthase
MSGNIFGKAFRVTTFGESHGPAIGLVIDGMKPGIPIDLQAVQEELNRRRPGQSKVVSSRQEQDRAEIISGIFEGKTTGTPLCIMIKNQDQRSRDYIDLQHILRPGHAGFSFLKKYGVFDFRGGGRASGRETATRVAAGAVAKQLLKSRGIEIVGYTRQIGNITAKNVDFSQIEKNAVRAPDTSTASEMTAAIQKAQKEGDSLGGLVEVLVRNCPVGLGEPVFNKLEADLASALMSIGAVKAFEMGDGFNTVTMQGSEFNDLFYFDTKTRTFHTRTNHAGGVLGGISNGEHLIMRIAVKPPSSIGKLQETVDDLGHPVLLNIGGRHDPCICPRVVPVAEAMVALVLIDHLLMQEQIEDKENLAVLRFHVDTIDTQLMLLLAQRREVIRKIGAIKKRENRGAFDREREASKRKKNNEFCRMLNLPLQMMQKIFEIIVADSHELQKETLS